MRLLKGKIGTGIDLFFSCMVIKMRFCMVTGTGIWPLGMGNDVLKNGNGIDVMRVYFRFFYLLKYNVVVFRERYQNRHKLTPEIVVFRIRVSPTILRAVSTVEDKLRLNFPFLVESTRRLVPDKLLMQMNSRKSDIGLILVLYCTQSRS